MINLNWQRLADKTAILLETRTGTILFRGGIVCVVLLLILYFAYGLASVKPGYYKRFEAMPREERKKLNDELVTQVLDAYSQIQKSDKWSLGLSDQQLNGWLSVDGSSKMLSFLPKDIQSPRLAVHGDRIEIAAPVTYGSWSATAVLSGTIRVPEPGVISIRFRSVRLGVYPFSKENLVDKIKESLDKPGWELVASSEGGDPVLSFRPPVTIDNQFALTVESFQTDDDGRCLMTGRVAKVKHYTPTN